MISSSLIRLLLLLVVFDIVSATGNASTKDQRLMSVSADRSVYREGENPSLTVTITNTGSRDIILACSPLLSVMVRVRDAADKIILPTDVPIRVFTRCIRNVVGPQQSLKAPIDLKARGYTLPPGSYHITLTVLPDEERNGKTVHINISS